MRRPTRRAPTARAPTGRRYFSRYTGLGAYKKRALARTRTRRVPQRVPRSRPPVAPKNSVIGDLAGTVGSIFGGPAVGNLASTVGNAFSKVLGLGAYSVKDNVLVEEMVTGKQVPVMHSSDESVIIRHREYICDVSSSTSFTNRVFEVNPGLSVTFPWLSTIAQNFEQYKWRGLIFEYKSTSANALNSTNTALGSVAIASEYNTNAQPFFSKSQVLNNMWTCNAKPSENFMHPIECAPQFGVTNLLYVRTMPSPSGQDKRLYDMVNVQLVTEGSQAVATVGELWATYEIELFKPQIGYGSMALGSRCAHYRLNNASNVAHFGTTRTSMGDYIGLSFLANEDVQFPIGIEGKYLVQVSWLGDSTACTKPAIIFANCSALNFWNNGTYSDTGVNATTTLYSVEIMIDIPDPTKQASFVFNLGTLPANCIAGDLLVVQINGNVN